MQFRTMGSCFHAICWPVLPTWIDELRACFASELGEAILVVLEGRHDVVPRHRAGLLEGDEVDRPVGVLAVRLMRAP